MPRRRHTAVRESLAELAALTRRCRGTRDADRLAMLAAIRRDPRATFANLARRLGYAERTLLRWWHRYCLNGLEHLITPPTSADPSTRARTATTTGVDHPTTPVSLVSPVSPVSLSSPVSPALSRFLNSMPTTSRGDEWMRSFHASLKALLAGVDMITLRVNLGDDVETSGDEPAELVIVDEPTAREQDDRPHGRGRRRMRAQRVVTTPGRTLIAQMIAEGFPASEYQIPLVFDYFVETERYVGTIVLWRDRSRTPVPAATVELMRTLHQFIAFALSDCVARTARSAPEQHYVRHVVDAVAARIGLKGRELEVFALQLAGADRREIAERQGIALSTVGKVIASIHAKAGTRNYAELLTRFAEGTDS